MSDDLVGEDLESEQVAGRSKSILARFLSIGFFSVLLVPAAFTTMGLGPLIGPLIGPLPDDLQGLQDFWALGFWSGLCWLCLGIFKWIEMRAVQAKSLRNSRVRILALLQLGFDVLDNRILGLVAQAGPVFVWINFLLGWIFETRDGPILGLFEDPNWAFIAIGLVMPWPPIIWIGLLSLMVGTVRARQDGRAN